MHTFWKFYALLGNKFHWWTSFQAWNVIEKKPIKLHFHLLKKKLKSISKNLLVWAFCLHIKIYIFILFERKFDVLSGDISYQQTYWACRKWQLEMCTWIFDFLQEISTLPNKINWLRLSVLILEYMHTYCTKENLIYFPKVYLINSLSCMKNYDEKRKITILISYEIFWLHLMESILF